MCGRPSVKCIGLAIGGRPVIGPLCLYVRQSLGSLVLGYRLIGFGGSLCF